MSIINVSYDRTRYFDGEVVVDVYIHPQNSHKVPGNAVLSDEFASMVEAVKDAIALATRLRVENNLSADTEDVTIGVCYPIILGAGGLYPAGIIGHEPYDLSDQSLAELRKWAAEWDERLPKCDHCGEIIGRESYGRTMSDGDGAVFCSTSCLEAATEEDDKLECCAHCGTPITDKWYTNEFSDGEHKFCSEYCAQNDYWESRMHEQAEREDSDAEYEAVWAEYEVALND